MAVLQLQTYSESVGPGQKSVMYYTLSFTPLLSLPWYSNGMSSEPSEIAPQPTCQNHVFYLDSDALGVNCRAIRVFEETDHVGFCRLLKGIDGRGLEPQIRLGGWGYEVSSSSGFRTLENTHPVIHSDLTNKALEGQFSDEQFGGFLKTSNFAERYCSRAETKGFLPTGGRFFLDGTAFSTVLNVITLRLDLPFLGSCSPIGCEAFFHRSEQLFLLHIGEHLESPLVDPSFRLLTHMIWEKNVLALCNKRSQSKWRTETSSGRLSSGSFGSGHLNNRVVQVDRICDWGMKERKQEDRGTIYIVSLNKA